MAIGRIYYTLIYLSRPAKAITKVLCLGSAFLIFPPLLLAVLQENFGGDASWFASLFDMRGNHAILACGFLLLLSVFLFSASTLAGPSAFESIDFNNRTQCRGLATALGTPQTIGFFLFFLSFIGFWYSLFMYNVLLCACAAFLCFMFLWAVYKKAAEQEEKEFRARSAELRHNLEFLQALRGINLSSTPASKSTSKK